MMIITTWKCDKCGKEQLTNEQMWYVGYICENVNLSSYQQAYTSVKSKALWCRKCCNDAHLVTSPKQDADSPKVVELTLAEKLENIVREIVVDEMQLNKP